MKDKLLKYLGFGLAIGFMVLWLSNCWTKNKEINVLTADLAQSYQDYDSCVSAKVYVDTIVDTVDRILGYVEVPIEREVIRYDTIWVDSEAVEMPVLGYFDTLKTKDFELYWRAEAIYLSKIEFPYYRLYDATVVESNVIEKVRYKDKFVYRSGLYFYFGLNTKFEKGLSGFGGGFDYINRKGWGLGVGYLRVEKDNMMQFNVKMRIL